MDWFFQQVPFGTFLIVFGAVGLVGALWGVAGMPRAYRSIGHGGMSLDVPYSPEGERETQPPG